MTPIIGLTDVVEPQFGNLGYLHKGSLKIKKTRPDGSSYETFGSDLDHFRFTSERKDVEKAFREKYGEAPAELHVFLPYSTPEENWNAWKELWKAGGLIHRCNGKEVVQIYDPKAGPKGGYIMNPTIPSDQGMKPMPCPGGCSPIGRLKVIIPGLWQAGFVGTVTLLTHSLNDIMHIQGVLLATWEARMGGRNSSGLRGVEFTISRRMETISTPGDDGKRVKRDKWLVKLEPSVDWIILQHQIARGQAMKMLEAPPMDEEDEPEDETSTEAGDPDFRRDPGTGMKVDLKTGEVIDPGLRQGWTIEKPVQGTLKAE